MTSTVRQTGEKKTYVTTTSYEVLLCPEDIGYALFGSGIDDSDLTVTLGDRGDNSIRISCDYTKEGVRRLWTYIPQHPACDLTVLPSFQSKIEQIIGVRADAHSYKLSVADSETLRVLCSVTKVHDGDHNEAV